MKKLFLFAVFVVLAGSNVSQAQDMTGDWQGSLRAGVDELRLVLHITKAPDGSLKATLDSVDQGANGIPVNSIALNGSQFTMTVDAVHGTYNGEVSKDAKLIHGTWSQGTPMTLDFAKAAAPVPAVHQRATPSDIDGAWLGELNTGAVKLRVVFHIANTADGLIATMDSLDQGVKGMPMSSVTREGASLKIEAKQLNGAYSGTISKDLTTIDGTWTQGGTLPLTLKKVKDFSELNPKRPQDPVKPYPYRSEDVSYENKAQNVTLAATITIPPGPGPFPAAVLITGSGPQDRDETVFGHHPFLVLSDYLTRKGIVVLRADDRGVGKSTGTRDTATTADYATDTEAGISYLKTRPEVNVHKIGLIGHSEGGVIAPMIAAHNADVAFIVMMAGTGVPGDQVLIEQARAITATSGGTQEDAEKAATHEREVMTVLETEKDPTALDKALREKMGDAPGSQADMQIKTLTSPWIRYFITYDPSVALRQVKCPVLALNGTKDVQVIPSQNLPAIRKALEEGGNKNFEIDELPGLNHLFQTADTGAPTEYTRIDETIAPVALEKISTWVSKQ